VRPKKLLILLEQKSCEKLLMKLAPGGSFTSSYLSVGCRIMEWAVWETLKSSGVDEDVEDHRDEDGSEMYLTANDGGQPCGTHDQYE